MFQEEKRGQVILLNGTSSAGKTTVAKYVQLMATEPYQIVSLDEYRDGMPPRYRGLNSAAHEDGAQGLNVIASGTSGTDIVIGDYGKKILRGMRQAVAALAHQGINVIVDDMANYRDAIVDYASLLEGLDVLTVAVTCSHEELERREKERPGRFRGTALSQLDKVHRWFIYDLTLDTSKATPECISQTVLNYLESKKSQTGLAKTRTMLNVN